MSWSSTTTDASAILLSTYLRKHGYRVTIAASAQEARAYLGSLAFEIIVLDVMMPGESGFDFAASLRQTSQVPILMLTARSESSDRVRGLEIGVDDYLAKPHEPQGIAAAHRLDPAPRQDRRRPKPAVARRSLRAVQFFAGARRIARP